MKKIVILTALWCTCISLWVLFWFSEKKNSKPARLILKTEAAGENSSSARDVQKSNLASDTEKNSTGDADTDNEHSDIGNNEECININTSDTERLCLLPGVGPGLAEKIVTFRQQNGTFKGEDDLLKVKGIGTAKLGQFQSRICF